MLNRFCRYHKEAKCVYAQSRYESKRQNSGRAMCLTAVLVIVLFNFCSLFFANIKVSLQVGATLDRGGKVLFVDDVIGYALLSDRPDLAFSILSVVDAPIENSSRTGGGTFSVGSDVSTA